MKKTEIDRDDYTKLIIIGGGEDKKADKEILKKVIEVSGGKDSRVAIITTATNYPLEVGEEYKRIFYDIGAERVEAINIRDRIEANRKQFYDTLSDVSCLFFVGGDQLRISSILGGTSFHKRIMELMKEGLVVAGTSAGASMMSQIMVVEGDDEDAPRKCTIKMAPGMGFLNGAIVDQHFNQRGRIGRLLGAVAQNPSTLGIGIDEDTAIVVNKKTELEVIGSGVVTIVDGMDIEYTNISEQFPNEPLVITNIKIHILPTGYGFNLVTRKAILQHEEKDKEEQK
ncbi:cyanophycinase [Alkaliphilus serpentinus]|uniref:Cyanophycinase n=1 Tax=Alkaliphilus serpentinus TaxID=1482731 RepID=A0A833HNY3_9FIRM|nr:cyanophycinase [Alkaliphilus serpentinus]KAB3530231.1 cyanophycinase [Alkaliphilus serpentinus]